MKISRYVAGISLMAILVVLIVSFGFGSAGAKSGHVATASGEQWMHNRMIAHAMGSVGVMFCGRIKWNRKRIARLRPND